MSARAATSTSTTSIGASIGPCDIYNAAGTPCVAAHSMARALYGTFYGPLYSVMRLSDGSVKAIWVMSAGGLADSAAQDMFCANSDCVVQTIFDQSPKLNHLDIADPGYYNRIVQGVNASRFKVSVGGNPVYGAYFEGGMGYRNDKTHGVAKDDEPQSMYMITAGKHYNDKCCFDYGGATPGGRDDGPGTMAAMYWGHFGSNDSGNPHDSYALSIGTGNGPWVMADLEWGLFGGTAKPVNYNNTPIVADFVTSMYKEQPHQFALKGGDAQSGSLKTLYEGKKPDGYDPMRKGGAIILGIGGDNSHAGVGTFYEGVMTYGYSSDATDEAVQANIVAAGYGNIIDVIV